MGIEVNRGDLTVAYASIDEVVFKPGRREFIKYRDLGVEDASSGRVRAEILHVPATGERMETGWHYHECEMQYLYVLEGNGFIEFLDGRMFDLKAGDSLMIPGGTVHRELGTGEISKSLEITIPAQITTVNVEIPERVEAVA